MDAVDRAVGAIDEIVDLWSKHVDLDSSERLSRWAGGMQSQLTQERDAIERHRTKARAWPSVPVKQGKPTQPTTYLLEVLVAYFRHHGWRSSTATHGLFAQVAEAVTNIDGGPTNYTRLLTVVASRHKYATLTAKAPRISDVDRGHHAEYVREKTRKSTT